MDTPDPSPSPALWAPWRAEYFTSAREPDFLLRAGRAEDDREHLVVVRRRQCFLLMNRYPYAVGHVMAVPYRKVCEFEALTAEEVLELWDLAGLAQRLLRKAVAADGFNIGLNLGKSAGAGVRDHLHLHVVPRREGDHNFMPVLAGTQVHSEGLDVVYERLLCLLPECEAVAGFPAFAGGTGK